MTRAPPLPRASLALCALALLACEETRFREAQVDLDPAPAAPVKAAAPRAARGLLFSVAAVESPRDTYSGYSRLFERVGARLGIGIEFVQRRTYREVNDLLATGKLDAALVCTGGYLDLVRRAPGSVEVLAVPVVRGEKTYHSLVIVRNASRIRSLEDLAGKRFAFSDELSLSGRTYVVRQLRDAGHDPSRFFASAIYTQSHDRSVKAVAAGLVDGAAVHSGVYAHLIRRDPQLAHQLRVVHQSPPFGAMPVVAATSMPREERERLREALVGLSGDPEGAEALRVLELDGFEVPPPGLFATAAHVVEGAQ
jgi:phosphonate transport system substrate-binding protein